MKQLIREGAVRPVYYVLSNILFFFFLKKKVE